MNLKIFSDITEEMNNGHQSSKELAIADKFGNEESKYTGQFYFAKKSGNLTNFSHLKKKATGNHAKKAHISKKSK